MTDATNPYGTPAQPGAVPPPFGQSAGQPPTGGPSIPPAGAPAPGATGPTTPLPPTPYGDTGPVPPGGGFPPAGGGAPAGEPGDPKDKKKKLLTLGIAIGAPVLALLVGGIVIFAAGGSAANDYFAQADRWESQFNEEAFSDVLALDASTFSNALYETSGNFDEDWYSGHTVGEMPSIGEYCSAVDAAAAQLSDLSSSPPEAPSSFLGGLNPRFNQAVDHAEQNASAYAASKTLADDSVAAVDTLNVLCDHLNQSTENAEILASGWDGYLSTLTLDYLESGYVGTWDGYDWSQVCYEIYGCPAWDDMSARSAAGDAWDQATTAYHEAQIELYENVCPADAADACATAADEERDMVDIALAVSDLYRNDDPVANGKADPDTYIARDLRLAGEDYQYAWHGIGANTDVVVAFETVASDTIADLQSKINAVIG